MNRETCASGLDRNNGVFVDSVLSIIDSKIQYLDYQTKAIIRPLLAENAPIQRKENSETLKLKEQWFLTFERISRLKKSLLLLRNYLNKENAFLIFSLLADEQLILLSQKDIEFKLGIPKRYLAA